MTRFIAVLALLGAVAVRADVPLKWQFAGENQGIQFYFRISNECKESGAKVEMKLENTLDHAVTVNFRLVDPDWEQKFAREVGPNMKDTAIKFTPENASACHPYVDEVYVQSRETQVSKAGEPMEE